MDEATENTPIGQCAADCSVVIVAGGHSKRFGRDKANALWEGRKMINHVVARTRPLGREIIAVCRAEQESDGWEVDRVVHDAPGAPAGPLRGLVCGLQACRTPWAWVLSCDAPQIAPALLPALRQAARAECVAVVPIWDGHPQPLTALYGVGCEALLRAMLEGGERSPARALSRMPHLYLPESACRQADPGGESFLNVNRPQDLDGIRPPDAAGMNSASWSMSCRHLM